MAIPALIPLAMGAAGAYSAWRGGKKAKRGAEREAQGYAGMAADANRRMDQASRQAGESRNMFMSAATGARDFDPSAAMRQEADAMMAGLQDQYRGAVNARNANKNARGMFNSGFGEAAGQRDLNDAIGQGLSSIALRGAGMKQGALESYARNVGSIYDTDIGQGNMYYNAATGLRGSEIGARAAGDQAGAQAWGDVGGALIGTAGQMIPYTRAARRW